MEEKQDSLSPEETKALQEYLEALAGLADQEPPQDSPQWQEWSDTVSDLTGRNQSLLSRALLIGLAGGTGVDPSSAIGALLAQYSPRFTSHPAPSVEFPLDKINSNVWGLLEDITGGQLAFATEKRGTAKEATVLYSINFDGLQDEVSITKKLTPFDKRCYIAVSALFNSGNAVISPAQIYTAIGNKGRPSAAQLEKVNKSLTKMGAARVYINNEQELDVNKRYKRFVYDASLLPFERMSAYINNVLCDSAVHLFREPPLVTFAKGRGQITTISRVLLESPVSKTDTNLRIDDYLIERISHIKAGTARPKLLWKTLFQHCGITEKKQRQRTPEKVLRYLEHYKACGFIQKYRELEDGILIE